MAVIFWGKGKSIYIGGVVVHLVCNAHPVAVLPDHLPVDRELISKKMLRTPTGCAKTKLRQS